ncbi:hypothetical protein B0H17DRAFT_1205528 [Mycena rosella]|uniref:Uncharacterized protein n=1 Tax=Mycena rosella TaxID=1033263 RepID=A0AAD7GCL8_MYCRO|nr:hypothetical protein B0H17DRAFT_1205528 [Mycena rosella]
MSNLVIVDDQSSQIKYTGLWTGLTSPNYYDHTASSSRVAGTTMTFPFSGTSVSVAGSFDAETSCTGSFSLDANITNFVSPVLPTPLNHQSIWTSVPLIDGPHTLTYTLASCSSSGDAAGYVWFDYILYTPSANASTNGLVYFVDDNDPQIIYSGDWTAETGNDEDFGLTSHGGKAGCSFQLQFEGTFISVHGRIGNDSAGAATQASFSVDSTPVVFSTPYQSNISYNQLLFQSNTLAQGKHTLVGTSQSGTVWVDYILVQPNPSTDNTTLASTHHSSVNVGEIAGVALGALVLAVGIAVAVIFRRRLCKGRRSHAPSRPLSHPPNIHAFDGRDAASTIHVPWQSANTYPPTVSAHSFRSAPSNPFDTPPISPRSGSFAGSSSADSQTALIPSARSHSAVAKTSPPPPSWPANSFASSSGHSRRPPSLGGDGDSVADLKRRQQLAPPSLDGDSDSVADLKRRQQLVPSYDDSLSIASSSRAPSTASSRRPLPVIPSASSTQPVPVDDLDLPPVYTVQ